jgi:hypothetical protein
VIKALLLIFEPTGTWEGIYRARRSTAAVFLVYLLPFLLLVAACEAYGLVQWGKWQGEISRLRRFSVGEASVVAGVELLLSIGVVFGGASLVKALGETFHGRHTYQQAFTAVAYGLSPLFLLRLLDLVPAIYPWVSWMIGILLSAAVLYHGVPRMMEPDPPHAFGLYVMSTLLLAVITGLVRFVTTAYLLGKFPTLQAIIEGLFQRPPS